MGMVLTQPPAASPDRWAPSSSSSLAPIVELWEGGCRSLQLHLCSFEIHILNYVITAALCVQHVALQSLLESN